MTATLDTNPFAWCLTPDDGKFGTILMDPPWPSGKPKSTERINWMQTNMKPRYDTMTKQQLYDLPVTYLGKEDSMLVMWATWMHLDLAFKLIERYGYRYCTGFPWLKVTQTGTERLNNLADQPRLHNIKSDLIPAPIYGPGVWVQSCTELVLIGRRGHPFGSLGNPRPARKGLIIATRQEHSRKPGELQDWIDAKLPGPYIELFARNTRPGWTSWGNEIGER